MSHLYLNGKLEHYSVTLISTSIYSQIWYPSIYLDDSWIHITGMKLLTAIGASSYSDINRIFFWLLLIYSICSVKMLRKWTIPQFLFFGTPIIIDSGVCKLVYILVAVLCLLSSSKLLKKSLLTVVMSNIFETDALVF